MGLIKICNGIHRPDYTPSYITELKSDEIFVFGNNLQGLHSGGAARIALNNFGAVWGQGVGLQGQSYAIPTMHGCIGTIKPYIDQFLSFAKEHTELFFFVTRIGCGIAGFKDNDIAPLFKNALEIENICLPKSFVDILLSMDPNNDIAQAPQHFKLMLYGQCRTFADIVKTLNNQKQYHSFEELLQDFGNVIEKYGERGCLNNDSLNLMETILLDNKDELFDCHGFHFGKFNAILERTLNDSGKSAIDIIFSNRQRAKLLILMKTLNDICQYTDVESLRYDLLSIATGRFNCGDNSYMNDPLPTIGNYPINWFLMGLRQQWDNVTTNGVLDNQRLENVMFTNHSKKVEEIGINAVIANDFIDDGPCHPEVFYPKEPGTAPVYVKDEWSRKFIKACGEGKGPRRGHELYEFQLVKNILLREVGKGNYEKLGNHFIPTDSIRKPVFIDHYGRIHFSSLNEKRIFIDKIRRSVRGC